MSEDVAVVDCQGLTARDVADRIGAAGEDAALKLVGGSSKEPGMLAGRSPSQKVVVDFTLGNYALMLADVQVVELESNVGDSCCHSMTSGGILVRGSTGDYLGLHASGGMLAVWGTTGNYCGCCLDGADLFVRSLAGDYAGCGMRSGTLVLGNGAGRQLGAGMQGGVIYARGDVKSVSADVKMARMKDPDLMRLSLLLARAGIKSGGKDFKAFRAKAK